MGAFGRKHFPVTASLHELESRAGAKKRAGLLRLSGDKVADAFTQALRRVMRPT